MAMAVSISPYPAKGMKQTRWIHSNHSYKSGGQFDSQFGLGKQNKVDVKVTLLSGKQVSLSDGKADQFAKLDLESSKLTKEWLR